MFRKNSNFLYKKFTFFECDFFCSIYERKYFIFMADIADYFQNLNVINQNG